MQHSAPSWAGMSTGGFSVLARSTICTWPECVPGKANRELLLFGHSTHRPEEDKERKRASVENVTHLKNSTSTKKKKKKDLLLLNKRNIFSH